MISTSERRHVEHARIPCAIPVELTHAARARDFEADAVDLSAGGLSLRSSVALPELGAELHCSFETVPGGRRISGIGEVVWAQPSGERSGEFGLRFTKIDPEEQALISEMIAERVAQRGDQPQGQAPRMATLELEQGDGPITAKLTRAAGHDVVFEQPLNVLSIGSSVVAHSDKTLGHGNIRRVDLRMDGGTPTLALTVRFSHTQEQYGEFDWEQETSAAGDLGAGWADEIARGGSGTGTVRRPRQSETTATLAGLGFPGGAVSSTRDNHRGYVDREEAPERQDLDDDTVPDSAAPDGALDDPDAPPLAADSEHDPFAYPEAEQPAAARTLTLGSDDASALRRELTGSQSTQLALFGKTRPGQDAAPGSRREEGIETSPGTDPVVQAVLERERELEAAFRETSEHAPRGASLPLTHEPEPDYLTPHAFEEQNELDSSVERHAAIALGEHEPNGTDTPLDLPSPFLGEQSDEPVDHSRVTADTWEHPVPDEARRSSLVRFLRIFAAIANAGGRGYAAVSSGAEHTWRTLVPHSGRRLVRDVPATLRGLGMKPRRTTGVPTGARDLGPRKPWRLVAASAAIVASVVLAMYALLPSNEPAELALHRELALDDKALALDDEALALETAESAATSPAGVSERAPEIAAHAANPVQLGARAELARTGNRAPAAPRDNKPQPNVVTSAGSPGAPLLAAARAAKPASAAADASVFGHNKVSNAFRYVVRMSEPVKTLQGKTDPGGFTVIIPGSLAKDRAGPLASAHKKVARATILNKGDHSELTVRFSEGKHPAFRVSAQDAALEILISK